MTSPDELIGVFHADGGLVGETRYVVGRLLGRTHCGLCDISHRVRRKPEWDAMVARLGLPFDLLHLNELPPDVASAVTTHGSPVVLGRHSGGLWRPLLTADRLDALHGSVEAFEHELRAALAVI